MKRNLIQIVIAACFAALVSLPVTAQTTVASSGVKAQASVQDNNIKTAQAINAPDQKIIAPASKGGPRAKGAFDCHLHINNSTALFVDFYFNGYPAGSMGPWGDLYPEITVGRATLYARAVFRDGSVVTFGPRNYDCTGYDNSYTWTLTP